MHVQFLVILKKMRILVKWCHEIEEGWTHYHLTRYNSVEGYSRGGLDTLPPNQVQQCRGI
jgi:hypothetical protein